MLTVAVAGPPLPPSPSLKYFGPYQKKNRPFLEMNPGLGVGVRSCRFLNFKSSVQTNGRGMRTLVVQFMLLQRKGPPPETAKQIGNQAFYNIVRNLFYKGV